MSTPIIVAAPGWQEITAFGTALTPLPAASIAPDTVFPSPFRLFPQTAGALSWAPQTTFGEAWGAQQHIIGQHWFVEARGFPPTIFGGPAASTQYVGAATGWLATTLGEGRLRQGLTAQPVTTGAALGLASAAATVHAQGFVPIWFGSASTPAGHSARPVTPSVTFGFRVTARNRRKGHRAFRLPIPQFGRPTAKKMFGGPAQSSVFSQFGDGAVSVVHRALHLPPEYKSGAAIVRRIPTC